MASYKMFNYHRFNIFNILILGIIVSCACKKTVEINLKQGALSGLVETSFFNSRYYSFRGIPYANPPLGPLRFKPPVPQESWSGTLEAHTNKPTCFQFSYRRRNNEPPGFSGSEDCLYLSVYTPNLKGSAPVVVFDYNDNFKTGFNGSNAYSPDFFLKEGVIVVTINHRLGIFGYFTTEDDVVPPNAGLKDFILGLNWIKDNIKTFGGDPKRVTLMGNRGGAALVNLLLYSEKATGLFSAVIMQSGSAFETVYFDSNLRDKAFRLGKSFNVTTDDSNVLVEKLQSVKPIDLMIKEGDVIDDDVMDNMQMSIYPYSPNIEKDIRNAVLMRLPENSNIVNDVPVLLGFNSEEGLDLASHYLMQPKLVDNKKDLLFVFPIRVDFRFDRNSTIFRDAINEVQQFYLKKGYFYYGNIQEYGVYVADMLQNYALHNAVKQLSSELKSNVYYYKFDYRGLLNENSNFITKNVHFSLDHWGATISDELCYLHMCSRIKNTYEELKKLPSEQPEFKVLKKMVKMWTNFAKTGNPTPDDDELLNNTKWLPIDKKGVRKSKINYIHITNKLRMEQNPLGKRAEFWDEFLKKYRLLSMDGLKIVDNYEHTEL